MQFEDVDDYLSVCLSIAEMLGYLAQPSDDEWSKQTAEDYPAANYSAG